MRSKRKNGSQEAQRRAQYVYELVASEEESTPAMRSFILLCVTLVLALMGCGEAFSTPRNIGVCRNSVMPGASSTASATVPSKTALFGKKAARAQGNERKNKTERFDTWPYYFPQTLRGGRWNFLDIRVERHVFIPASMNGKVRIREHRRERKGSVYCVDMCAIVWMFAW
jgi:hypothetical protein